MRLHQRHTVARTMPRITIGRRIYDDGPDNSDRISQNWTAIWCYRGKQEAKSFKTPNRSVAIRLARQLALSINIDGQMPLEPPTLKEIVDSFYSLQVARHRAPKTLEKYDLVCRRFLHWADGRRDRPAELFREPDVLAFDERMRSDGLAEKTRYDRLILVKQFFNQAVRNGRIGKSPLAGVSFPIPTWSIQPCFEPEQVWKLLEASALPPLKLVWGLMAYAGLRFGEVRELRWGDLLLTRGRHGYICVCRGGSAETTKTRKNRLIPIHPHLRSMINTHPKVGERVVYAAQVGLSRNPTSPLAERPLLGRLKSECKRCGFEDAKQFKLHTFRHAFASMCARANVSFKYALAWMGHQSSEVLDLYYRMFDATADAAMETICYGTPSNDVVEMDYQI